MIVILVIAGCVVPGNDFAHSLSNHFAEIRSSSISDLPFQRAARESRALRVVISSVDLRIDHVVARTGAVVVVLCLQTQVAHGAHQLFVRVPGDHTQPRSFYRRQFLLFSEFGALDWAHKSRRLKRSGTEVVFER